MNLKYLTQWQKRFSEEKISTKQTQRSVILLTLLLVTITFVSTAIPAYAVPSGTHGRALKSLDDTFDDVATLMPGFGGMYLDGNVLKVYITDIGQKAMAENAIGAVFGGRSEEHTSELQSPCNLVCR